jgi:uncharacterized membrane protein YcaP (DUF421 family)
MFNFAVSPLDIIVRTAAIYFALFLGLRLAGKREIGQMTIFDLVVLLLISNAVQNAMVGEDTSLGGGILAAATLLLLNWLLITLRMRIPSLRRWADGQPTVLVLHGKVLQRQMLHESIDPDMLDAALREHGLSNVADVEMAVLETDGSISVVPKGEHTKTIHKAARLMKK